MFERLLTARGPFRFDLALRYYRTSPATIAEVVDDRAYARAFRAPGGPAVLTAVAADGGLQVAVTGPGADAAGLERASQLVERAFGLADDAADLPALAAGPGPLAERLRRYLGLRPLAIPDPFEALVWAILGQQINIAFAARLKRALLERYGPTVEVEGRRFRLFPEPATLAALGPDELRPLQFSRQKALYVRELAGAVAAGRVDLEALRARPDAEVVAEITALKGIGRWTAEYLLLRGFGRGDAIPAGDMGLRAVVGRLHGLGRNATEAEVRAAAEPFAPRRGYLAMALWFALQQREL